MGIRKVFFNSKDDFKLPMKKAVQMPLIIRAVSNKD